MQGRGNVAQVETFDRAAKGLGRLFGPVAQVRPIGLIGVGDKALQGRPGAGPIWWCKGMDALSFLRSCGPGKYQECDDE